MKLIIPAIIALSALAVPAMAQNYYDRSNAPITGAQLSDFPSSRANVTRTGSFLSYNGPDRFAEAPVRHRHHRRHYERRYDDERYYNR